MSSLPIIWFGLLFVLLIGYAILDGFDLGAGIWHLFARREEDRRRILQVIGPFWDGNEVWLVTAGGALFAAFPPVYATVFSGMYLALMLVLLALIARATAIEFRAHAAHPAARHWWDIAFAGGSILATLLFGVALGNILRGMPLDADGNFTGTFFTLLNPFALLIGLVNLAMIATQGATYLAMTTEGSLATRARRWVRHAWTMYLPLAVFALVFGVISQPHLVRNYQAHPALWLLPLVTLASISLISFWNAKQQPVHAFTASSLSIAGLLAMAGVALYPNLVPSLGAPAFSLTVANASSSPLTLKTMFAITLLGMPLVLGYTVWVYRTFRGGARDGEHY